jgi:hypothetical protein
MNIKSLGTAVIFSMLAVSMANATCVSHQLATGGYYYDCGIGHEFLTNHRGHLKYVWGNELIVSGQLPPAVQQPPADHQPPKDQTHSPPAVADIQRSSFAFCRTDRINTMSYTRCDDGWHKMTLQTENFTYTEGANINGGSYSWSEQKPQNLHYLLNRGSGIY